MNLAEYALDSDPLKSDASTVTVKGELINGVDSLTWTFPRRKDRQSSLLAVQSSTDLVGWGSQGVTGTIMEETPSVQIIRASVSIQEHYRFLRLWVQPVTATP